MRLSFHYGDLVDAAGLMRLVQEVKLDEVYNLGAEPRPGDEPDTPQTWAPARFGLEAIRAYQDWGGSPLLPGVQLDVRPGA